MEVENRYIAIRHQLEGSPSEDDFEVKMAPVRWTPDSSEVLVKNLYLSVDPYQLNRMKRHSASHFSVDAVVVGERIAAYGAGQVVASGSEEYKEGNLVAGTLAWEDYTLFWPSPGMLLSKIDTSSGFPLSYHIGVLGTTGMAAYGGFYEVCKPKKGEKVFVSAASGSVGQFAKLAGCYVVGCAGSKAKGEKWFNINQLWRPIMGSLRTWLPLCKESELKMVEKLLVRLESKLNELFWIPWR